MMGVFTFFGGAWLGLELLWRVGWFREPVPSICMGGNREPGTGEDFVASWLIAVLSGSPCQPPVLMDADHRTVRHRYSALPKKAAWKGKQSDPLTGCQAQASPDVSSVAHDAIPLLVRCFGRSELVGPTYGDKSADLCGCAPSIAESARSGPWTRSSPAGSTFIAVGTRRRSQFRLRIRRTNGASSGRRPSQRVV